MRPVIVIGVMSGLLAGVWATLVWGLRKAKRVGPELLLVVLVLFQPVYFLGADAYGWPTPGSVAVSTGAVTRFADRWLLLGTEVVTAVLVVALLARAGVTRRLERWSGKPE